MRQLVNSRQIRDWFSSLNRDAQGLLPHLIRRLIFSTVPLEHLEQIGIDANDEIRRRGYDGHVRSAKTYPFVPGGESVWEMGTADPSGKFEKDFSGRTKTPRGADPSNTTFVFVTPHSWEGKKAAEDKAKDLGVWRDVKILDSSDLESWLEASPAVARWLASQMNIPVEGMEDLSTWVSELEAKYNCSFLPDVVIGGRKEAADSMTTFFLGDAPEIFIRAESPEEAMAFISASVDKQALELQERLRSTLVIASSAPAVDYLAGTALPLVVLPVGVDATRRARARASKLMRVAAYDSRPREEESQKEVINLGSVRRQSVRDALVAAGFDSIRADRIAKESKGSFGAALMMISSGPDEPLPWMEPLVARRLAPLVLAGQWAPRNSHDKNLVAELAQLSERELDDLVAAHSKSTGPLVQRGAVQDWLGWDFAWKELASSFDDSLLKRFDSAVRKALLATDPSLELPRDKQWQAGILGKEHPYSHQLRSGLIGSLVQFAVNSASVKCVDGQSFANHYVKLLLGSAEKDRVGRWCTLAYFLPDLAEAAPTAFLEVTESMTADAELVSAVFSEADPLSSSSRHTHLLWALERLTWSPMHFGWAALLLAKLTAVDPGGKLGNRPFNSLRTIFLPWKPETSSTMTERLAAIDAVFAATPDVAWRLSLALMPKGYDVTSPTARPRWRSSWNDSAASTPEVDYLPFILELVKRMLRWSKGNAARTIDLIHSTMTFGVQIQITAKSLLTRSLKKTWKNGLTMTKLG